MALVVSSEPREFFWAPHPVIEKYGAESRFTYLDRSDQLHFRVIDELTECRLFSRGRVDHIREVEERTDGSKVCIRHYPRPDGLVEYARFWEAEAGVRTFELHFLERLDKLKSFHLSLCRGAEVDVGADSCTTLYRNKALHLAIKYEVPLLPDNDAIVDVYQDMSQHTLRIAVRDTMGHIHQRITGNSVPTEDESYEASKIALLDALKLFMAIEREVFINVAPFAEEESEAETERKKAERLKSLTMSLFATIDADQQTC